MNKKIALTGYSGFLGSALLKKLTDYEVVCIGRTQPEGDYNFHQCELNDSIQLSKAISGVDTIIHCAARAHIMDDSSVDPMSEYNRVNVDYTLNIARQALKHGVKRLIFISTVKVNGEQTLDRPFQPNDKPNPVDLYGQTKLNAELGLFKLSRESSLEIVVIRPPLIYGPEVKANFLSLMNLINKRLPLPFKTLNNNRRSMVYIENLISLILLSIEHQDAKNQVFFVSDNNDVSTSRLIELLSTYMHKPNIQLPIPIVLFKLIGFLTRKQDKLERLTGSLQVDIEKTIKILGWEPPFTIEHGLNETVQAYIRSKNND